MSRSYQRLDARFFDYDLQSVPGFANLRLRGPAVDLSRPYIACLGAAQTFGRFCHRPFPALLADRLGVQTLNLGVGGAGPQLFDTPGYLNLANRAEMVVLQVLSGRSESNSLFDNSATGTLHGTRVSDGKSMRFNEFLTELKRSSAPEVVRRVIAETQENYVAHMIDLLEHVTRPTVLLWFSDRSPDAADENEGTWRFPQLVTRSMIDRVRAHGDAYVECTSEVGIHQVLWPSNEAVDGTHVEEGMVVNRYYPSPSMHVQAAEALEPVCRRLLVTAPSETPSTTNAFRSSDHEATLFVVVCAERTGSNLFLSLISGYPASVVGGELFNTAMVKAGKIRWRCKEGLLEDPELVTLRREAPVQLVSRFFQEALDSGSRAVGFKLMYKHGDDVPSVREHLAANRQIRVVHLKRRNLLRRLLSERRAQATGIWSVHKDAKVPVLPSVHLDPVDVVSNIEHIRAKQDEYDRLFTDHEILEIFYEDFVSDPQSVANRAAPFLGLGTPQAAVNPRPQKTGTDQLANAISNYAELKAGLAQYASYFDE